MTAICTLMNFGALARLIVAILSGHAASGKTLLLDATNIWATNVVVFALWFWSLDRGGPAARGLISENKSDFLFTQQQAGVVDRDQFKDWSPGFIDYLFLAFTNATAFSPTDTFPLTARAKFLMMTEATISLCTIASVTSHEARKVSGRCPNFAESHIKQTTNNIDLSSNGTNIATSSPQNSQKQIKH